MNAYFEFKEALAQFGLAIGMSALMLVLVYLGWGAAPWVVMWPLAILTFFMIALTVEEGFNVRYTYRHWKLTELNPKSDMIDLIHFER